MKFIETSAYFLTEEQSALEDIGVPISDNFDECKPLSVLVNVDTIELINPLKDDKVTIQFISGERWVFAESYDTIKKRINYYRGD